MKVKLVFLEVTGATRAFGTQRLDLEIKGRTVEELLRELLRRYPGAAEILLRGGRYDPTLQIILNGRRYIRPEDFPSTSLREGDILLFSPLVDGG